MTRIAIFASGTGTNAREVIAHFNKAEDIEVALIISNKATAGVLTIAEQEGISSMIIDRPYFYQSKQILFELEHQCIDYLVLAGFLWLVPAYLVKHYKNRMINIHPALLPKYGGKGMYGMNVHKAVVEHGETQSGISIHYVNEAYDEGALIFQAACKVDQADTADDVRKRVQRLEHRYFPEVIEKIIRGQPIQWEKNLVREDPC